MLGLFFYLEHGSSTILQKSGNYPTKYVCHMFIVIKTRTSISHRNKTHISHFIHCVSLAYSWKALL